MWRLLAIFLLTVSWMQAYSQQPAPAQQQAATAASADTSGPEQPLPFSHKRHAGELALSCDTCHTLSPSGETLRIPQADVCMNCHQAIATDKPAIQRLAEYDKSNTPIPWIRIYQLPSFVSFSHKTHLDHGATCEQCHGQVAAREQLFKEAPLTMQWCVDCHTAKKASTDCNTCHTLDQQ
jgi:predicted CXXCH cytochrome family protein